MSASTNSCANTFCQRTSAALRWGSVSFWGSDIHKIAQGEWATTSVYRAMTPANQLATVSPSDSIEDALHLLASRDVNQLPVLRGRDFLGVITGADILSFIKVRQDIGGLPATVIEQADRPAPAHPVGS